MFEGEQKVNKGFLLLRKGERTERIGYGQKVKRGEREGRGR